MSTNRESLIVNFVKPCIRSFCILALVPPAFGVGLVAAEDADTSNDTSRNADLSAVAPDYRLTAGDSITVEMFEQPEIRTAQRLTANGEIRLALIGRVELQGLTLGEAERRLEEIYRKGGYFVNPQVTVSVQNYGERFVNIFGQVRNPTRVILAAETNSVGILQAITQTGGFTRIAKTDAVQVTRTARDGTEQRFVVNVQELLDAKRPGDRREFQLLSGDVVFVPEKAF